jgi:hypothetical protein
MGSFASIEIKTKGWWFEGVMTICQSVTQPGALGNVARMDRASSGDRSARTPTSMV